MQKTNSKVAMELHIIPQREKTFRTKRKYNKIYSSEPRKLTKKIPTGDARSDLYVHLFQGESDSRNLDFKQKLQSSQELHSTIDPIDRTEDKLVHKRSQRNSQNSSMENTKRSMLNAVYKNQAPLVSKAKPKSSSNSVIESKIKIKREGKTNKKIFLQKGNNHQLVRTVFTEHFGFVQTLLKAEASLLWYQWIPPSYQGMLKTKNDQPKKSMSRNISFSQPSILVQTVKTEVQNKVQQKEQEQQIQQIDSPIKVATQSQKLIEQISVNISSNQPTYFNHLVNHNELTNKENLYRNISALYNEKGSKVDFLPSTYVLNFKEEEKKVKESLKSFISHFYRKEILSGKQKKARKFANGYVTLNLKNYHIDLTINLKDLYNEAELKIERQKKFGLKPTQQQEVKKTNEIVIEQKSPTVSKRKQNMWILKPTSLNQGRGITVFTSLKALSSELRQDNFEISVRMYNEAKMPTSYVIQQYIENPLLIQNFKFDIRIWVLLKIVREKDSDGISRKKLKIFYCPHGYSRIASVKYQEDKDTEKGGEEKDVNQSEGKKKKNGNSQHKKNSNKFVHLTNIAVQKNSKQYGKLYEGNVLSVSETIQYIQKRYPDVCVDSQRQEFTFEQFHRETKQIVLSTIDSVKEVFVLNNKPGQFQLFGYDFLLDESLKLWLIEVNCNPSLEESSSMLSELLKKMLIETGEVIFDEKLYFSRSNEKSKRQKMWDYLGEYF